MKFTVTFRKAPAFRHGEYVNLLSLDGKQECNLAAEMARRDPKATDAFCVTLGQAVAAVIDPRYNSG
jgi:hypothetical protein